jgi:protein-S-isoprenylcysteine O-methyltransferase Ste14
MLADMAVKSFLQKKYIPYRFYRLFYSLISILGLLPVIYFFVASEKYYYFQPKAYVQILALVLLFTGFFLWKKSFINYSMNEFLGTDRFKNNYDRKKMLKMSGLNRWVRHPLYSIGYLVMFAFFLLFPHNISLIFIGITGVYILIGSHLEEKRLILEYGDLYREYIKKTPALFPDLREIFRSEKERRTKGS